MNYPKIRPPRDRDILGNETLIQIVNINYLDINGNSNKVSESFIKMKAKINETDSIKIREIDNLFLLTWSNTLELEAVNLSLSLRDDIMQVIPSEISYPYNELGDKNVLNVDFSNYWSIYYEIIFRYL